MRWEVSALRGTYRYALSEAPEGQVRGRYYYVGVGLGYAIVRPSSGLVVSSAHPDCDWMLAQGDADDVVPPDAVLAWARSSPESRGCTS